MIPSALPCDQETRPLRSTRNYNECNPTNNFERSARTMTDDTKDSFHELARLQQAIEPVRNQLVTHPVYREMHSADDLRWFMENHVFAVWDFMTLLKTLQRRLTSVDPNWHPVGRPATRRLINEIVLGEESDIDADGNVSSHFEMYLAAMNDVGASTDHINRFIEQIALGESVATAMMKADVPSPARAFVETTFDIIGTGSLPAIAAAFTFGREELIPDMFQSVLGEIEKGGSAQTAGLRYYLQRHIDLDGDSHAGLARQLVADVCQTKSDWDIATKAALQSLQSRQSLWAGVLHEMNTRAARVA